MMAGAVLFLAAGTARAQDVHGAISFGQIIQDQAGLAIAEDSVAPPLAT